MPSSSEAVGQEPKDASGEEGRGGARASPQHPTGRETGRLGKGTARATPAALTTSYRFAD